jgi:hypothetical protein
MEQLFLSRCLPPGMEPSCYFLAAISDGSWQSTYDLRRSNKEERLTDKNPVPQLQVVSVLANGTVEAADLGQ